jgi:hypothetical protein
MRFTLYALHSGRRQESLGRLIPDLILDLIAVLGTGDHFLDCLARDVGALDFLFFLFAALVRFILSIRLVMVISLSIFCSVIKSALLRQQRRLCAWQT